MCVSVLVYFGVLICVCVCVYVKAREHVSMCVNKCLCQCVCVCVSACESEHIYVYVSVSVCVRISGAGTKAEGHGQDQITGFSLGPVPPSIQNRAFLDQPRASARWAVQLQSERHRGRGPCWSLAVYSPLTPWGSRLVAWGLWAKGKPATLSSTCPITSLWVSLLIPLLETVPELLTLSLHRGMAH
jgi:hypothetical protein